MEKHKPEVRRRMRHFGLFFLLVFFTTVNSPRLAAQGIPPSFQNLRGAKPPQTPAVQGRYVGIPLPKPRPPEAGPRLSNAPAQAQGEPAEPSVPSECFVALASGLAEVQQMPPIVEANGCEAPDVVRLDAVMTVDRKRVPLSPPAVLRCAMATAIARWVREDLQPMVASQGTALAGLDNFNSFECRGRNRVVGAKTSEHGRANALDIRGVMVSGGRKLEFTDTEVAREFREALRVSVCKRFTTVLGPGSDGYHEDHVHVDLAERRNGYRLCQWDVRDIETPLPRARPAEAGPRDN